jgi:hypothetical protein
LRILTVAVDTGLVWSLLQQLGEQALRCRRHLCANSRNRVCWQDKKSND